MKDLLTKLSTTSVVAILIILLGFALLFYMAATGNPHSDTRATQLYTGILGLMGVAAAYYFSATKRNTGTTQNAENITNNPV